MKLERLAPLVLVGCAFLLFANTFGHGWTLDDYPVIVQNPDVRSWGEFFRNSYSGRPLRELSFILDYKLFGYAPAGWHFQNILWHGLNAGLLWTLVRRLDGTAGLAWAVSLLFLAHPISVETVANVSHRKESLMLFFALLSMLAYIRALSGKARRRWWLAAAGVLWVIACLGKEVAALLPLAFWAYEIGFIPAEKRLLARSRPICWLVRLSPLVLLLYLGLLRFSLWGEKFLQAAPGPLVKINYSSAVTLDGYFLTAVKAWAFMGSKFFWPSQLAVEYVFPLPTGWLDPWVISGIAALAALAGIFYFCRERHPIAFFASVWSAVFFLPVANFFWPISYFAADRYFYAISAGLILLLAAVGQQFLRRFRLGIVFTFLLIGWLSVLTWQQNRVWASNAALFSHAVAVSPDSTRALIGLGIEKLHAGELETARQNFQKSAMNFNDSLSLYYLGSTYDQMGDQENAYKWYRSFVAMNDPKYAKETATVRRYLAFRYGGGHE